MALDLKNRSISRFRCHIDPMIGPKPKNAFDRRDMPHAHFELTPAGVYVRLLITIPGNAPLEEEHLIPFANVQSIKLASREENTDK